VLFFTTKGKVHWQKVYDIPTGGRYSAGKAIVNLLDLEEGEKISASIPIKEFDDKRFLFFATKKGLVKKTPLSDFSHPRKGGIRAITLAEDDSLVEVEITDGNSDIVLAARYGKAIRFSEKDVRPMGRTAQGVIGMRLREKDEIVSMRVVKEGATLLAITENGYGKRTALEDYPLHRRGGKGVINIIPSKRNGLVVGIEAVNDGDEIMITSQKGVVIRQLVKEISVIGRNTQGVRLMKLEEGDKVAAMAKVTVEAL
jgi:DNA gyrase subunit A